MYSGSPTWIRTRDLRINSPSLYRLSYQGIDKAAIVAAKGSSVNSSSCIFGTLSDLIVHEHGGCLHMLLSNCAVHLGEQNRSGKNMDKLFEIKLSSNRNEMSIQVFQAR